MLIHGCFLSSLSGLSGFSGSLGSLSLLSHWVIGFGIGGSNGGNLDVSFHEAMKYRSRNTHPSVCRHVSSFSRFSGLYGFKKHIRASEDQWEANQHLRGSAKKLFLGTFFLPDPIDITIYASDDLFIPYHNIIRFIFCNIFFCLKCPYMIL